MMLHLLTTIYSFINEENNFVVTKIINKRDSVWKEHVSVIKIAGENVFDTIYFKIFIDENNTSDLRPVYLTNSQNIITKYDISNYINMHMRKHHFYKYINDLKNKISNKKYLQNYDEMIRKEYKRM